MADKPIIFVGLIGTGFMGKAHAFGLATAEKAFDLPYRVGLHTVADVTEEAAANAARQLGFSHSTADWRTVVADPVINVVNITAPNALHKEMALAAIANGKHVHCEKPLAPTVADAEEMTAAARARGVVTQVGFNYLLNPMLRLAGDMIAAGELGTITTYRGSHAEDYMADPASRYSFRHEPDGGGAFADIGSHALATAERLLGPIAAVMGDCVTVHPARHDAGGVERKVKVDDVARAFVRFASGASGTIEANWIATGRKMAHDFEVYGTKGALIFTQERFNELHFYSAEQRSGREGFTKIEAGPAHEPYAAFCPAPGHQLGFNDLKAIEMAGFLKAIADRTTEPFGFADGTRVQRLVEAVQRSSRERAWQYL